MSIQSRDSRPLDRYFPDLREVLLHDLPDDCVVDGEIVIVSPRGLDFDSLQLRLHPAASRVAKLAAESPASFVAFDGLKTGGRDLTTTPQAERRKALEKLLAKAKAPVHLTPITRGRALALDCLARFEGAGLDGVVMRHLRDLLDLLPGHSGDWIEVHPQLIRVLQVVCSHRVRMEFEAPEVRHPCQRGGIAWDNFLGRAPRWELQFDNFDPVRSTGWSALLRARRLSWSCSDSGLQLREIPSASSFRCVRPVRQGAPLESGACARAYLGSL